MTAPNAWRPHACPGRLLAGALAASMAVLGLTACSSQPPRRAAAAAPVSASPTAAADALTPVVDALSGKVSALSAQTTLKSTGDAVVAAGEGLRTGLSQVQAALKDTIAYHASAPKDCAGIDSRAATVGARARAVTDAAKAEAGPIEALRSAAVAFQTALDAARADLATANGLAASAPPSDARSRLSALAPTLDGLTTLRNASAQAADAATTGAADAAAAAAKQVETATKVADVCHRQAGSRGKG